jgi:hypothetical protein
LTRLIVGILSVEVTELQVCGKEISSLADKRSDFRDQSKIYDDFPAIKPYSLLPENEKAERSRRLNVVHCRRKRDQKLVDVETLDEECTELKEKRKDLLEENRRLEDLVRTANTMVERVEEEQGDPTSAQAETSSPSWSSAEFF